MRNPLNVRSTVAKKKEKKDLMTEIFLNVKNLKYIYSLLKNPWAKEKGIREITKLRQNYKMSKNEALHVKMYGAQLK